MIREKQLATGVATTEVLGCKPGDPICNAGRPANLPYKGFLFTPGDCIDACLLVLAGGVDRFGLWVRPDSPSSFDALVPRKPANDDSLTVSAYFVEMGISAALPAYLQAHGPLVLEQDQMMRFHLSTSTESPEVLIDPRSCGSFAPPGNCVRRDRTS